MRPVDARTAVYLEYYCNSGGGAQLQYQRYIYGAGRPHLSFDQLKMTAVLVPPLAEQEAIVEAVEDQLSVIDHLEADLDAKLKSAQALRQSILKRAFAGQLVPQDTNDEPASELLKRIAAERAGKATVKSPATRRSGQQPRKRASKRSLADAGRAGVVDEMVGCAELRSAEPGADPLLDALKEHYAPSSRRRRSRR